MRYYSLSLFPALYTKLAIYYQMSRFFRFLWLLILFNLLVEGLLEKEERMENNFTKFIFSSSSLGKNHLRIYARNYPPMMEITRNPRTQIFEYKGLAVEFATYLAQYLGLSLEYVREDVESIKNYGPAQTVLNALVTKEVDLVLIGMTPTPKRVELIDMTSPIIYDTFQIVVKWPEEMDRWNEVARPFDTPTWSMVAISLLVIIGMMTFFGYIYGRLIKAESGKLVLRNFGNNIMYVVGITTNQGQSGTYRLALQIMLCLWLLMMVVLINSYLGTLTSRLTVPRLKPIPKSLEELAEMKEYKITMMESHILANSFLNATSGTYKALGDSLREHPKHLFKQYSEVQDIILKDNGACVESSTFISFRVANDFKLNEKCRMTASDPIFHTQSFSAALTKNSPYTKIVDNLMLRALETGLIDYWKKMHIPSMKRCQLDKAESDNRRPKPITLVALSSAFAIIGIGMTLSILAFLFEMIVSFFIRGGF